MTKRILSFIFPLLFFRSAFISQCSFTPTITSAVGNSVCANSVLLSASPPGDTWIQKATFPGVSRMETAGFSIGSKGYLGLGFSQVDLWEYDPATNAWTQKANFPVALTDYHRGFSIGSKGYVAAISGTAEVFYEFDPALNQWNSKATPGGGGRLEPFAFSTATKGYLGGGFDPFGITLYSDLWEYDPTGNTWTQKANFGGGPRSRAIAFGTSSKGYVGLGYDASIIAQQDFWEYNPGLNSWTQKANYPPGFHSFPLAAAINNKGYVFDAGVSFANNLREYNPANDTWTTKTTFTGSTHFESAAFSIGSIFYFGSGASTDFFEYNSTYTYSWSTGATTSTIEATASANYSVTITDVLNCSSTAVKAMTINPYPRLVVSGDPVCAGNSATLMASGASSYTWSANAGGVVSPGVVVSPATSTSYTINATGPGNCTISLVKPVVVMAALAATIVPSGPVNLCGTNLGFTANPVSNTWTQKTNLGGSTRWRAASFSVGNKGYMGMGRDASFGTLNDLWEYDPSTDTWTQKANFPGGILFSSAAFSIGDKGYVHTGNASNNFWQYDPVANTWTQKTDLPGGTRNDPAGFSVGGRGYIAAGENSFNAMSDLWEYDPYTNLWTQRASFSGGARAEAFGISIGSKGYVGGGRNSSFTYVGDLWEYNPATNTWTQKANLPTGFSAVSYAKGFALGAKGYLLLGPGNFWEYEPAIDNWTQKANFGGGSRAWISMFGIGGKGYGGTGSFGATYFNDLWEYDPSSSFLWSNGALTATTTVTTTGNYSVLITSALGCTASTSKAVTINPVPVITTTASVPSVCMGGTTALSAGGASTYAWTGGVIDGTAFSPTVTLTYTVTGTAVTGCTNTAVRIVTVNNTPTVTATASNSVICQGYTTSLSGGGASSYVWTGGVTNGAVFSPTATLSYTVTGTDAATGCTNAAVKAITVNPTPSVTATATQSVICRNIPVTLNGGGANSYTWTGGVTNGAAFAPTVTTTYTVTGANAFNCTNTAVTTITVNALPSVSANTTNSVICLGGLTALSGVGASTYTWTGGITNGTAFSPTVTQNYTVTGTDANTCTNTAVMVVTVNPLPSVTANASSNAVCMGGSVTLSGGGATSYTWSHSITDGLAFAPAATTSYTVTGTDAATGCTNTAVKTITVNSVPVVTANATQSVICMNASVTLSGAGASTYTWTNGVSDGVPFSPTVTTTYTVTGSTAFNCTNSAVRTITVHSLPTVTANASNTLICEGKTVSLQGGGAISYIWTNGVTDSSPFSPSTTATYTVTGTDANTCTNTAVAIVSVNALPPVTINASSNAICFGGSLTLSNSGASTYTWSHGVTSGSSFSPTSTTSYTLSGTNAVTGCTNVTVKTITVNTLPSVTANVTNPVICFGDLTTLSGGGASTYTWTGGAANGIAFSPTLSQTYTVTGTDANTCTNTAVTSITVNSLPAVSAGISSSVICLGSMVVVTGSGANTYTWSGGVSDGSAFSPSISSSYTVTGFDLNNCFNKAVTSVTVNALPAVTASSSHSAVCFGNTVTLSGGGANSYTWSGSVTNGTPFTPLVTDSYTVAGSDANGCTNTAVIPVTVNPLPNVTANASSSVICLNYTTSLSGSGAITYTWTGGIINGGIFSPTVTDTYTVTGTDANGCKESASQLIIVNPLPAVSANASSPVICVGDLLTLNGGGANLYTWTGGAVDGLPFSPGITATYTVTGIDLNNCTNTAVTTVTVKTLPVVTGTATPAVICNGDFTTLKGGGAVSYAWSGSAIDGVAFNPASTDSYTVIGTGVNGCSNTAVVGVTVNPLPPVTASASHSVICLNYTTSLSGGGALSYTWSGTISNGAAFSPTITDTYTVTGKDAKGCMNSAVITVTVNPLPAVTGSASNPVICSGESLTLTGSGASSYTWTSGVTNGAAFSPTLTDTYTVTGTDVNTCSNTAVVTVTVNSTPTVTASASSSVICFGDATALSGGGAVSYAWTGGINDGVAFTPSITGSYTVTGTSADGCTSTAVASVTVNALPLVTAAVSSSAVCDGSSATFAGGGAITYTWTNGVLDGVAFTPTATATYTVAGTDLNGCINTNTVSLTVDPLPLVSGSASKKVICSGESVTLNGSGANTYTWSNGAIDGVAFSPTLTTTYTLSGSTGSCVSVNPVAITITVNAQPVISVNGGTICTGDSFTIDATGALSYTYSGGQVVSPSSTTDYSITGTNAEGCVNSAPAICHVLVNLLPVIGLSSTQSSLCTGSSATINATGASTYLWSNNSKDPEISVSPGISTIYTVTGTDLNSCKGTGTIQITVAPLPTISIGSGPTNICRGTEVTLTGQGADTYSWSSGDTGSSITKSPVNTITYSLTGTNGAFCSATKTISIVVNPPPILDAGPDVEMQAGEIYQFTATQAGAVQFSWSSDEGLSDPNILNPTTSVDHDITYTLTAASARGCKATDEVSIKISDGLVVANYMSPNGDGKNDTWKISNLHLVKNCSVEILDSWGKTVFTKSERYNNEFDAKDLPDGVYYYFIKNEGKLKYKGSITITR